MVSRPRVQGRNAPWSIPLLPDLRRWVILAGLLHGSGAAVLEGCAEGTLQKATKISVGNAHSCAILVSPLLPTCLSPLPLLPHTSPPDPSSPPPRVINISYCSERVPSAACWKNPRVYRFQLRLQNTLNPKPREGFRSSCGWCADLRRDDPLTGRGGVGLDLMYKLSVNRIDQVRSNLKLPPQEEYC